MNRSSCSLSSSSPSSSCFKWINIIIQGVSSHGITPHVVRGVAPCVFRPFFSVHFGLRVWNKKIYVIPNLLTSSKQKVNYIIGQPTLLPLWPFYQNYGVCKTRRKIKAYFSHIHQDKRGGVIWCKWWRTAKIYNLNIDLFRDNHDELELLLLNHDLVLSNPRTIFIDRFYIGTDSDAHEHAEHWKLIQLRP